MPIPDPRWGPFQCRSPSVGIVLRPLNCLIPGIVEVIAENMAVARQRCRRALGSRETGRDVQRVIHTAAGPLVGKVLVGLAESRLRTRRSVVHVRKRLRHARQATERVARLGRAGGIRKVGGRVADVAVEVRVADMNESIVGQSPLAALFLQHSLKLFLHVT
jgi:hypothetical protein